MFWLLLGFIGIILIIGSVFGLIWLIIEGIGFIFEEEFKTLQNKIFGDK